MQETWDGGEVPCKHNHFSPGVCELLNCLLTGKGKRWQKIVSIIVKRGEIARVYFQRVRMVSRWKRRTAR